MHLTSRKCEHDKMQSVAIRRGISIFERIKGSGIWWIRWTDTDGRKRREKAGSRSNAEKLLAKRHMPRAERKWEAGMLRFVLAFFLSAIAMQSAQVADRPDEQNVEEHIRKIIAALPAESALRQELLSGARESGEREPWMNEMRMQGIKKAVLQISIHFDRHGRAKQMAVKRIEFFREYDGGPAISDTEKLKQIRSSGLDQALEGIALRRAAHGSWMDIPHPRPQPSDGGASLEFFDDEWLPAPSAPLYCAGKSCFSRTEAPQSIQHRSWIRVRFLSDDEELRFRNRSAI